MILTTLLVSVVFLSSLSCKESKKDSARLGHSGSKELTDQNLDDQDLSAQGQSMNLNSPLGLKKATPILFFDD